MNEVKVLLEPIPTKMVEVVDVERILDRLVKGESLNMACSYDQVKAINAQCRHRGYRCRVKSLNIDGVSAFRVLVDSWPDGRKIKLMTERATRKDGVPMKSKRRKVKP